MLSLSDTYLPQHRIISFPLQSLVFQRMLILSPHHTVIQLTDQSPSLHHSSPMFTLHITSPKALRTAITIIIWLLAALIMSACSPHITPSSQSESAQQQEASSLTTPIQQKAETLTPPAPAQQASETASKLAPVEILNKAEAMKENTKLQTPPITNVLLKKKLFFAFMKPIVMNENNKITQQRQNIIALKAKDHLSDNDIAALQSLVTMYGLRLPTSPDDKFWESLLNRVDIIPVELALVQAANESAWGRSHFARDGNNYFGQWCFRKGCGIVPRQRSSGASHEVRRFKSATESVHAYMKNINTSKAYTELRKMRSNLRKRNIPIHAVILANGLKHYSERGMAYVKTIRAMIRSNQKLIDQSNAIKLVQDDAK